MGAGRKPNVVIQQEIYHGSKEELENREEATPIYQSQEFIPPDTLSKEELKIWNDLVKIIRGTQGGYVSDADIMVMEAYCKSKVEYDRACKEWDKNRQMYIQVAIGGLDKDGEPRTTLKVNPNYTIKKDFSAVMLKYLDQLGISPLGRAKQGIQSSKSKKEKDREELMAIFNRSDDE